MKNHKIFYFLTAFLFIVLPVSPVSAQSAESLSPEILNKIKPVENNLVGIIMMDGNSSLTIRSRMNHYNIKGVSIAVIHNYKLEWAKGYGWADDSARIPISPARNICMKMF